jgi:hypothetical protein
VSRHAPQPWQAPIDATAAGAAIMAPTGIPAG